MRSKLRQLRQRTETSGRLLEEAVAQQKKTQQDIDSLTYGRETSRSRPYSDWWDAGWVENDVLDAARLLREQHQRENLLITLRDDKEEVDACVRSHGISACREISECMFEHLPRELRDIVYRDINQEAHAAYPQEYNDENKPTQTLDNLMKILKAAKDDKLKTTLDHRFIFFERHYFQASYMGSSFVREVTDTHFRMMPFKIQHRDLFSKRGHQDFFLTDKYGLGFPLGQLLSRVEVTITSLDYTIRDSLQPLMAIANTECIIELTSPTPLIIHGDYGQEDIVASSEVLLEMIALNLRRMKFKGYSVGVRYQGQVVFTANERDNRTMAGKPSTPLTRLKPTPNKQRSESGVPPQKPAQRSVPEVQTFPLPQQLASSCSGPLFGRLPVRPRNDEKHHGVLPDKECVARPKPAVRPSMGEELKTAPTASARAYPPKDSASERIETTLERRVVPKANGAASNTDSSVKKADDATHATYSASLERKQNGREEDTEDIKAFYEKRRAEIRAFSDSHQR